MSVVPLIHNKPTFTHESELPIVHTRLHMAGRCYTWCRMCRYEPRLTYWSTSISIVFHWSIVVVDVTTFTSINEVIYSRSDPLRQLTEHLISRPYFLVHHKVIERGLMLRQDVLSTAAETEAQLTIFLRDSMHTVLSSPLFYTLLVMSRAILASLGSIVFTFIILINFRLYLL